MRRRHDRNPVLAHEIAHQRCRPDASQRIVFFSREIVQILPAHFEHAFGFHEFTPFGYFISFLS
jgi:hypothetical protein